MLIICRLKSIFEVMSENQNNNVEDLLNSSEDEDEDDLEIPAFLRRQKN